MNDTEKMQPDGLPVEEATAAPQQAAQTPEPPQQAAEQPETTLDVTAIAEALKLKVEQAEAETAKVNDKLLRTAAEYDNFRKRSAREQEASFANGISHAVTQILGILDTLEIAATAPCTDEAYKKGVTMTLDKAAAALGALNVEEIEADGQPFDPELHSAMMQQPAAEGQQSGTIVQVFQKGYKLGDKVIRHSTVIVAE